MSTTADDNLFGMDGDEHLQDSVEEVAEYEWDTGRDAPFVVQEFTSKPLRAFVRVDNMLDHLIEYDLEEQHDEYGDTATFLAKRAKDPAVVAAFDAALDLMFEGMGWRWADKHVANWTVTWEPVPDGETPEFHFVREELA